MSILLTLALTTSALPSVEDVIRWLPENTETLMVARKAGWLGEAEGELSGADEARQLLAIGMGGPETGKARLDYEFVVNGSRAFKRPKSLGLATYEGCKIIGLKPAEFKRVQAIFKAGGKKISVDGREGYEFSRMMEQDKWTFQVVFVDGVMLCATHDGYLKEVLKRRGGKQAGRALPDSLPQWKFIDQKAPFWVVRQVVSDLKTRDEKLFGYAMTLTPDEKQLRVVSLSKNPNGFEMAKGHWEVLMQPNPSVVKKLSAEASEVMFAGDGKYEGRLMFMLMAAVGTSVYL